MWRIKERNFGFIKETFWLGHSYEFCDNSTGSDRRGPKVSLIKRIPHAYVTDIGKSVIVSARHEFKEFNFCIGRGVGGGGGGSGGGVLKGQLIGFQPA